MIVKLGFLGTWRGNLHTYAQSFYNFKLMLDQGKVFLSYLKSIFKPIEGLGISFLAAGFSNNLE